MNSLITVSIEVFGAFRSQFPETPLRIQLHRGSSTTDLRNAVRARVTDRALLDASVFATESHILDENAVLDRDARIAILPPVCGG